MVLPTRFADLRPGSPRAPRSPGRAAGWAPWPLRTADGVSLHGIAVPAGAGAPAVTWVVAHGFTNHIGRASFRRRIERLSRYGAVRAVDFRGHGRSGGRSGLGADVETDDLDSVVAAARAERDRPVITLGFSMGAAVALRQAAYGRHRPDVVVAVSPGSRWWVRETAAMRRVHFLLETWVGSRVVSRALGVRLGSGWEDVPRSPIEAVGLIAPRPLLLVHGDRDTYFTLAHAEALTRAAGPGVTSWRQPGMGHAEAGLRPAVLDRIARWAIDRAVPNRHGGTMRG